MASKEGLIITNKEMFNYAKNNKHLTQTDLLARLLFERFGISALLVKDDEYTQYKTQLSSITRKLSTLLQNCSKSKTLRDVNKDVFMDLNNFPLFRVLKGRANVSDPNTQNG